MSELKPPTHLLDLMGAERASVPKLLAARVARSPERTFLTFGTQRWSYGAFWEAALRVATFVRGAAGPHGRVGTYVTNCPEAILTWFGTHAAGLVYVALNREHRGMVLSEMIRRSGIRVLITEPSAIAVLSLADLGEVTTLVLIQTEDSIELPLAWRHLQLVAWNRVLASAVAKPVPQKPGDVATIMFTSGSTGRSKAVRLTHNHLCRGASRLATAFRFSSDDVFHAWLPLYHIMGQLHVTMTMLCVGGCVALYPRFSRRAFWSEVHASRATIFSGFASILHYLAAAPPTSEDANNPLKVGLIGNIPPTLGSEFERRFNVRLLDTYGMTEAEPITVPPQDWQVPAGSCGVPGEDFEVQVFDENDLPCAAGALGEIVVRPRTADVMFRGYELDDEATTEAWRNLWFHTQDYGYMDERGFLYFVARRRDAIRRRGENISAWEVEAILAKCPGVSECTVVGVPSPLGDEEVKAIVTAQLGARLTPESVHEFCVENMARFMVPRYIEICEALPYMEVGKINKAQLRTVGPTTWDSTRSSQDGVPNVKST